ncbi:bifunctional nuclease family protein [Rubritalea tangerina]|uniref:Bifunctional nuclease family protein n=1 Tax=Rubritalea tangerina TaxID=430798 RepID=A0ABW4Z813_9BACT
MSAEVVRVEPVALMPTQAGCAVFLGDGEKVTVFYVDPSIGAAINIALANEEVVRPLTHDLFNSTLQALGGRMMRALIVRVEDEVYYARLFIEAQNEIMERKIVEMDARPSDCIALAVRCGAPVYFLKEVWDGLEDMQPLLEKMKLEGGL